MKDRGGLAFVSLRVCSGELGVYERPWWVRFGSLRVCSGESRVYERPSWVSILEDWKDGVGLYTLKRKACQGW
jgi:hypothetical protein